VLLCRGNRELKTKPAFFSLGISLSRCFLMCCVFRFGDRQVGAAQHVAVQRPRGQLKPQLTWVPGTYKFSSYFCSLLFLWQRLEDTRAPDVTDEFFTSTPAAHSPSAGGAPPPPPPRGGGGGGWKKKKEKET
jgi:hypothetical protein